MGASFAIHHYAIVSWMHTTFKVLPFGFWETDFDENLLEMYVIVKIYSLNR